MAIDLGLFIEMLKIDSTTGRERVMADFLCSKLADMGCDVTIPDEKPGDEPVNVLARWGGEPIVTFCTHMDTVPPYIPPTSVVDADGDVIEVRGRGTCDAKGQIISMIAACQELHRRGETGFALLLLHGEETGSFGAKEFRHHAGGQYVVVGEPTDNRMASASKGTKSFEVTVHGRAAHSGYPEQGISAVERFVDFVNKLRSLEVPVDPELGETTYNIGKLVSDNPQNILSPKLTCRVYFRTTFATDAMIEPMMRSLATDGIDIKVFGGDTPSHYLTVPGIATTTVAFGSDAPQLTNFEHKSLVGAGSILVAHTDREHILVDELNKAAENYINIFYSIVHGTCSPDIDA